MKKFIYHALHKTGSTILRVELRKFCFDNDLTCLTYDFCEPWRDCSSKMSKCWNSGECANDLSARSHGKQRDVDYGSFTAFRLFNGCCRILEDSAGKDFKFDGLVEHFPMNLPENQKFLKERFDAGSFRFTILRDPIQQFVSNYKMHQEKHFQKLSNVPRLKLAIDEFYDAESNDNKKLSEDLATLHNMVVNNQAKELGWDGTRQSLDRILENLHQMDFVGIFESMSDSWKILRSKLGWSGRYLQLRKVHGNLTGRKYSLSKHSLIKVQALQYADLEIYEEASQIFAKFASDYA